MHKKLSAQMHEFYETNKEKLAHLPKESEDVKSFLKWPEVKKVFDWYDWELKVFFDFYCKCETKWIGFWYEDEIKRMDYREIAWFAY